MRCKACYPGDLMRCDREDLHEGLHMAVVRQNAPTREKGDRVTWARYWEPVPLDPEFVERMERARGSNMKYRALGLVA